MKTETPFDIISQLREDAKKSFLAKQKQFSENSYIEGYLEAKLAIAIKKGNLTYEDLK